MSIPIHATFLPQDDPDAAISFYREVLGCEIRNDVGYGVRDCAFRDPAGNMVRIQESS